MKLTIFYIDGRIPSKKNSRSLFSRGGRIVNIPSNDYLAWHKDASSQIKQQLKVVGEIGNITSIVIRIYFPDKRKSDLTNKAESVMDLLVDNKVIQDDSWQIIPNVVLSGFLGSKETCGASIQIHH